MIVYHCDACGTRMADADPNRYIVRVETFAAASPIEITERDVEKDHTREIRELIDTLSHQSQDTIEDSVYRHFRYDLCASCHAAFLAQSKPGLPARVPPP